MAATGEAGLPTLESASDSTSTILTNDGTGNIEMQNHLRVQQTQQRLDLVVDVNGAENSGESLFFFLLCFYFAGVLHTSWFFFREEIRIRSIILYSQLGTLCCRVVLAPLPDLPPDSPSLSNV